MRITHTSKFIGLQDLKSKAMPEKRICTNCKAEKLIREFRRVDHTYDRTCNPCTNERRKELYRLKKIEDAKYEF